MTTTIDALVEALELIEPHLDKLVDYSATAAEHPLNLAPAKVRAALALARAEQAEPVRGYGNLWPNGNPSRGDLSPEEDCHANAPK